VFLSNVLETKKSSYKNNTDFNIPAIAPDNQKDPSHLPQQA
jgi:hypothetical protein